MFTVLFDTLDQWLAGTDQEAIIKALFEGTEQTNHVRCKECAWARSSVSPCLQTASASFGSAAERADPTRKCTIPSASVGGVQDSPRATENHQNLARRNRVQTGLLGCKRTYAKKDVNAHVRASYYAMRCFHGRCCESVARVRRCRV